MKRVALFSLVVCSSFFLHHADSAEFFGLGDFVPNGIEGYVVVSGDGEVVVAGGLGNDTRYWTRETGWKRLLDDQAYPDMTTGFIGLSRSGIAAGTILPQLGSPHADESTAIRWDRDNGIVSLGYLPGDDRSSAIAVSQDGTTILGSSWHSDEDPREPELFFWNVDTGMQAVPAADVDGWWFLPVSDATGRFYGNSWTQAKGVEWTAETGVQFLDIPGRILNVSYDGSTIVGYGGPSVFQGNAFVWIREYGVIDFEDLVPESWQYSAARGVSADGSRVVGWGGIEPFAEETSFVFTLERGVSMLGSQIGLPTDANPDLKRWEIYRAEDISDDGNVIVGRGRNPQGKGELWMFSLRGGIPGDFDMSGSLTSSDIDLLHKALAMDIWLGLDANMDGLVNVTDAEFWVHELSNTWYGDANLDTEFNSSDLVQVFVAGKYETEMTAGWAEGDWDGNGLFDSADMVRAFADAGYEQGPRTDAVAVPEPTSALLLVAGLIGLAILRRPLGS